MAPRAERKLAAILAADVVGYSRLVGADEAGTIARLRALRKDFIGPPSPSITAASPSSCVRGGVGDRKGADEAVPAVDAEMVLVAEDRNVELAPGPLVRLAEV
jgi:class 3 adenylate cyclase